MSHLGSLRRTMFEPPRSPAPLLWPQMMTSPDWATSPARSVENGGGDDREDRGIDSQRNGFSNVPSGVLS